ncbi:tyrosine-type recombinase/integrase [Rhodococcoides fascians]|uniref:tyrosine-type recombinase/integrase n=1 Tax=Rhodococcoides fascians TaxID=1828 RepID=UPI00068D94C7|nr:tyrosine-type recombinase/integrase [Rhodococcus fascians]
MKSAALPLPEHKQGGVTDHDLWELVPEHVRPGTTLDMLAWPWNEVIYHYPSRTHQHVALDVPDPVRHEFIWWLWSLHVTGERVSPSAVSTWMHSIAQISTSRVQRGHPPITSFLDLDLDTWITEARSAFTARHQRLPGARFSQNHLQIMRRLRRAVAIAYHEQAWWQAELWDPLHDSPIPARRHEPRGHATVDWSTVEPDWLRAAGQWWLGTLLNADRIRWGSVGRYRTSLCAHLGPFLIERGIDSPVLVTDPATMLRPFANDFLGWLRTRRAANGPNKGQPLSNKTISLTQTAVNSMYAFFVEHRDEAAFVLGDPRWRELTERHLVMWPRGETISVVRSDDAPEYLDDEDLSRVAAHLDLIGLPVKESRTIVVDGQDKTVFGLGDPQVMRAYLLLILTGRRVNEILMLDPDPLCPLLTTPGQQSDTQDSAPESRTAEFFVARLRYQQTKIDGAPNTIPVEQAVVNIIREQQDWVRDTILPTLTVGAEPKYLFLARKGNQRGQRPLGGIRQRLTDLAALIELRDKHGCPVDFQRTHRLRHTKATQMLNAGTPLHVVQRYLGHVSPEMTLRYAKTLARTHEEEFLRLTLIGTDGRDHDVDQHALLDVLQLDQRTDRILPNGYCLLPRPKTCERGNACLTCGEFATNATYLTELEDQRDSTLNLIETRRAQHFQRTGKHMTDDNMWLTARRSEVSALNLIIANLISPDGDESTTVQGAGVGGRDAVRRASQPRTPVDLPLGPSRKGHRP